MKRKRERRKLTNGNDTESKEEQPIPIPSRAIETFECVIHSYKQLGQLTKAIGVYRLSQALDIAPTVKTLNAIMSVYAKKNEIESVKIILSEFASRGLVPDRSTLRTLVNIFSTVDLETTELFYKELQRHTQPDLYTSNVMLSSYVRFATAEDQEHESTSCDEIALKAEQFYGRMALKDEVTHNTMIALYVKKRNTEKAKQIFDQVRILLHLLVGLVEERSFSFWSDF